MVSEKRVSGNVSFLVLEARDGLPDPKGSLSLAIPLPAISMANQVVTEATTAGKQCRLARQEVQTGGAVLM